jgi:predicted dehydrogenase
MTPTPVAPTALAPTAVAVIGCGHFGRYHAEKLARLDAALLVAVVDSDADAAARVAAAHGCQALTDYRELAGRVQAVSVVVPTALHFEVAAFFLEAGVHVLVEKPITRTVSEARHLVDLAGARGLVLQVGHLERFNAAVLALSDVLERPLFVESHRLAAFQPRGTDVTVVLDLMIHDIDLIQTLVGAPLARVEAVGVPVLSAQDDIANARLAFESGCIANVTASRVSLKAERKMRLFQRDCYVSIDFQNRQAVIARKGAGEMFPGVPNIALENRRFEQGDALLLEIEAFLRSVREGAPVAVTGEQGLLALETAERISASLQRPPA